MVTQTCTNGARIGNYFRKLLSNYFGGTEMTAAQFAREYGTHGLGLLVSEFIRRSPAFIGDEQLAAEIGKAMGKLEAALMDALASERKV